MEEKNNCPVCKKEYYLDEESSIKPFFHQLLYYDWERFEPENRLSLNLLFEGVCPLCNKSLIQNNPVSKSL